ncbi:jg8489 [Pararge aegeria aegeria]|uniref:Jg8489 protein n=1 Tax=Pararge aegeria aegeria TaxID=348720 RepID=A0A8S4RXZ4_9NEOP|nr:jg8489 [Pararge aegeria aegeria]
MELLENLILKLNVHTKEIRSQDLQEVMLIVKKTDNMTQQFYDSYTDILAKLWCHLTTELPEFDDQLLCCTCFYSVLSNSEMENFYLNQALQIINHEKLKEVKFGEKKNTSVAVSLCYGLFQSSYLMQQKDKPHEELVDLLNATFELMMQMAYEYSQHTFIVFKIMTSFKKVIETPYQQIVFNRERKIKLLNLINHNWENPITGVRNLNRIIFKMLLHELDNDMHEQVLHEINGFYWNKAKFLMLTEIIEHNNSNVEGFVLKNQWILGLIESLNNPGLVSAGADMYYAILKKLISENNWKNLFLTHIIKILIGTSFKAIENFSNYWCLTTFKKFPNLAQVIITELKNVVETEQKLFSFMTVLKQANRLGLVEKKWSELQYTSEETMVLSSLEHCNASIRMLAFEIICVSNKKDLPSDIEFKKVLDFLQNNVNTDCTVLRISTLNNLANFFMNLHTSYINYHKNREDLYDLRHFCKKLQLFIIDSLNLDGNYQRKLTTVKMAYLTLLHFNKVPRKKQKQTRGISKSLIGYLKENGYWLLNSRDFIMKLISLLKDPATDIHDCILQILLDFYLPDISDTMTMNYLIEESFKCIKSKFFFEISCGLNIFKLIINIIIRKERVAANFKNIEDIFNFTYNEIIAETNAKINVVESIARGKQLHSFLSLIYIIFDLIIKNSYKMELPVETMDSLLNILKDISNNFAWEEDTNTSSDFSKMNDMVLSLIDSSSFEENRRDETKISGLYQIVLNCLWLNVKASCELAGILIQYNKQNVELCEESLNIIVNVLETSRHKGAIEAAGASLGQGIRYLTSSGVESNVSKLPLSLLKRKLNELLLETTKMSSVTRRGAGLSIMIHRIVSNDATKGKPLFHYFMKIILNTCNSLQGTCDQEDNAEKDLPKAIFIHFLTRIVIDSSLASDMMYYSAELAELAFGNLTNPHWQIRNAALQLYGALIPKLIGQKKPTGSNDEIISSIACDEFRTHSIKLWDSMIKQIKNDNYQDIIQAHSNLVPILNTMANIARRYNFSYDLDNQRDSDLNLLPNIFALLGSPIFTVRRLTSKLILNIYSFDVLMNTIKKVVIPSENHLHGTLMAKPNNMNPALFYG